MEKHDPNDINILADSLFDYQNGGTEERILDALLPFIKSHPDVVKIVEALREVYVGFENVGGTGFDWIDWAEKTESALVKFQPEPTEAVAE